MTHEELLADWYAAKRSVIHDRSGDISRDMRELHAQAVAHAEEHGISFDIPLDDWHKEEE